MIPRGCESRNGTPITLVSLHTSEGAITTASLASFLDQPGVEASYHVLVDDHGAVRYLSDDVAAWAMLSGNHRSLQVCLTGFARWPRSEWLVHDNMLRTAAAQVRVWCRQHNIPAVKLTPAQVGADLYGVCGHWDWTLGKRDGTHTDPGAFFPWDVFMGYVNPTSAPTSAAQEALMTWRLERTAAPLLAKSGDHPDGTWTAVEDTVALPGPAAGWRGRIVCWPVFGYGGGWVQEGWWGGAPGGDHHIVTPDKGLFVPQFTSQYWPAPDGARFLVLRYAAAAGGSVGVEPEH